MYGLLNYSRQALVLCGTEVLRPDAVIIVTFASYAFVPAACSLKDHLIYARQLVRLVSGSVKGYLP